MTDPVVSVVVSIDIVAVTVGSVVASPDVDVDVIDAAVSLSLASTPAVPLFSP